MNKGISEHSVKDLLSGAEHYLIPMYQRNYAWGEGEITQLIQDVLDTMPRPYPGNNAKPYYIGTLVVFRRKDRENHPIYEVIDGQQRLTTLYLLASYLRHHYESEKEFSWFQRPCILFESRPNSSRALLAALEGSLNRSKLAQFHTPEYNQAIITGYTLIQRIVPRLCEESLTSLKDFARYLFSHVQIMRVEVPEDTDLNHYFEIMNTRGEQLEKHEVLKALLMRKLDPTDHLVLHRVWEACANMERYVQMGFSRGLRDRLFGEKNWGQLKPTDFCELTQLLQDDTQTNTEHSMTFRDLTIQQPVFLERNKHTSSDNEEAPERFNTVINFPNFLLQVLRASTGADIPLDDKRLIPIFDEVVLRKSDAQDRVKRFIYDLLKGKFLFDKYIIKREFVGELDRWSLKRLKWQESNSSNDYVNTFGAEDSDNGDNRRVLMLLSALHVSTPTMVYKHWLNGALHFLFSTPEITYRSYLHYLESMTRCFVYDRFLATGKELEYHEIIYQRKAKQKVTCWSEIDETKFTFGKITNNLVFNFLDYLLWLKHRNEDIVQQYEFSFRSSVEHFHPQRPMPGIDRLPDEHLNSFGNLCLISHSKNSRLSNLDPQAKKGYYRSAEIDSVKQWLMMKPESWTQVEIQAHNDEMLEVLKSF